MFTRYSKSRSTENFSQLKIVLKTSVLKIDEKSNVYITPPVETWSDIPFYVST